MRKCLLLFFIFNPMLVRSEVVNLDPQRLIDLSLKNSNAVEATILDRNIKKMDLINEKLKFDYLVSFDPYYNMTKAESLDGFANERDKRLGYSLSLQKKLIYGSVFKLSYEKLGVNTEFNTFNLTRNIPETQYKDVLSLELEQPLLYNSLGKADRLNLENAESMQEYYDHTKLEDIENHVLQSMEFYWQSYIAKLSFEEALASHKRYEELLKTVKRKAKLGYTAPGELARTEAELEQQSQKLKLASQKYIYLDAKLKQHLKLSPNAEINYILKSEIPELPSSTKVELSSLRELKKAKLQGENANRMLSAAKVKARPELNLLAKIQSTGVETTGEASFEELAKFSKPTYYLGFRFRFHFGSGSYGAEEKAARNRKLLSDVNQKIVSEKLSLELEKQINLVNASYLVAKSAKEVLEFRNKAMREIKLAFTQGRIDIQELINAYNAQNLAATNKIQAVAEYHLNLNRMAALRDELVVQ
jgi:outer membrane protein TolC